MSFANIDHEYLVLLSYYAYVSTGNEDEVVGTLYEFVANYEGFAEADKGMTHQMTK